MNDLDKKYEDVIKFHGHKCPGLAIGIRASEIALRELGESDGDEEIVCISETDMCGIDAIQYMTNCTLGKGNLVLHHYGKMAFTFYRRSDEKGIRIILKDDIKGNMEREEYREFLLTSPLNDLFKISDPLEPIPPKAYRELSFKCVLCGENTMESMTRNYMGEHYCLQCYDKIHKNR